MINIDCMSANRRPSLLQLQLKVGDVKRDDELLRKLMLEIEASPDPVVFYDSGMGEGDEDTRIYYHLRLLTDAGFLEETGRHGGNFRITNDGHDFIALMQSDGMWERMKGKATEVAPRYGLRLLFEIGNALVRAKAKELGLPLD